MKTLKTLRGKFAAFTLIELLVVISIIAVLASLALPAVTGALAKGQIAQTTSNYRQAYVLTQSASLDSQQGGGQGAFPGDLGASNNVDGWQSALVPAYCSLATLSNLVSVKGFSTNTLICLDVKSSSEPSSVFLAVAGVSSLGTTNGVKYDGTGPYLTKGGALVTVGGSAVSFVGTNSTVLTNGTILMVTNGTRVTF
jgi:prepilin-type N-terminal cleavage/methylation domain-containing protein